MGPAPKPAADAAPDRKPADSGHWTLQLVSTPDQAEAQRMMARAKAAGFPAAVVAEKGLFKVRLIQAGNREAPKAE